MCELWQHQGQRRSGEEMLKELENCFSPDPVVTCGDTCWPPSACRGPQWKRYPHCSLWKPSCQSGPERKLHLRGSPCWSRILRGLVAHGEEHPCRNRFSVKTCNLMGYPHRSIPFLKDCIPWKGPMLYQFMKKGSLWEGLLLEVMSDCIPWTEFQAEAGKKYEEKGVSERRYNDLTILSFPISLHCSGGRWNIEKVWVKVSEKGEVGLRRF